MVGVNPGKNVTSHFTKLEIMPLKMLFNYGILQLFLETYGKDEIDNIVPSHNYDSRKKTVVHWCQIVQVPVGREGRLRARPHGRSGIAPLGPWYTVCAVLTRFLAHSSVWSIPGQHSGQPPL